MRLSFSKLAVVVVVLALSTTLLAGPNVIPPNAKPFGATYAQWGTFWWQWVFSLHALNPVNPLLSSGPVDCTYGQTGKVWFLAGTLNAGVVDRNCTIPTGKTLFFPVLNGWCDNVANHPPVDLETLKVWAGWYDTPQELHASIDGVPVPNLTAYRGDYAPFGFTVPETDSIAQYLGADIPGYDWPSTYVFPAVSTGYWLMVNPLPPGEHVINFGGTSKWGFQIDVTYRITVVPGK